MILIISVSKQFRLTRRTSSLGFLWKAKASFLYGLLFYAESAARPEWSSFFSLRLRKISIDGKTSFAMKKIAGTEDGKAAQIIIVNTISFNSLFLSFKF